MATEIKCRRFYTLSGFPAVGGMPPVQPERVYVVRREPDLDAGWFHVRFDDGARLCMHETRFMGVAP